MSGGELRLVVNTSPLDSPREVNLMPNVNLAIPDSALFAPRRSPAAFQPWISTTAPPISQGAIAQTCPDQATEAAEPGSGRGAPYRWTGGQ